MTEKMQVYKCIACGNIVLVLHEGQGDLVCCDQPMVLMKEKTLDQGNEKHVPVIEKKDNGILVKVGSIPHPMEEKHYIEWIELTTRDGQIRKFLKPGDAPEAFFPIMAEALGAREYCNLHGLWSAGI